MDKKRLERDKLNAIRHLSKIKLKGAKKMSVNELERKIAKMQEWETLSS